MPSDLKELRQLRTLLFPASWFVGELEVSLVANMVGDAFVDTPGSNPCRG